MKTLLSFVKRYLPTGKRFEDRRFLLDQYHFDLTAFEGDVAQWLSKFPVNSENVEIHYALAELFRRRGEFDKAVTVHEAISEANIETHSSERLKLEIAQDYYAAGVLSHAESMLNDAISMGDPALSHQAFRLWLSILESEQDWERAVLLVEKYGLPGSGGLRLVNLYCEYVLQLQNEGTFSDVVKVLKKARKVGLGARVELMSAELLTQQGKVKEAIQAYRDVILKDVRRLNLVLPALKQLSIMSKTESELIEFLKKLYAMHPSVRIVEMLFEFNNEASFSEPFWQQAVVAQAKAGRSKRVMDYWLEQQNLPESFDRSVVEESISKQSLQESDFHACTECGFHSEQMLWQCPQCQSWETLFSNYEVEIARLTSNRT